MGEPLDSEYSTPKWRRWARAWLDRPFRVSNQAPHSWQTMSLLGSTSSATPEGEIINQQPAETNGWEAVTLTEVERGVAVLRRPKGFGRRGGGQAFHSLVLRRTQRGRHGQQGGDGGFPHH